jgi:hypothetical protein
MCRAADAPQNAVDFRYSPPEWQTAICLPDDPHKSLVDKNGVLLYHYQQGGREFGTQISVEVTHDAVWQGQDLPGAPQKDCRSSRSRLRLSR